MREATSNVKQSLLGFNKKISGLRSSLLNIEGELEKLDDKIESFVEDITSKYIDRIEELSEYIEELEEIIDSGSGRLSSNIDPAKLAFYRIASTVSIIETVLELICDYKSPDFQTISRAFIYKAIYESLSGKGGDKFLIDTVPPSALTVVIKGRDFLGELRSLCDTRLTERDIWENVVDEVANWWRGTALPLLYGHRLSEIDHVKPMTLEEMDQWENVLSKRVMILPGTCDTLEIYRKYDNEQVLNSSGVSELSAKVRSYFNSAGKNDS